MFRRLTVFALPALLLCLGSTSVCVADITPYSQDFESLDISSPTALGGDGWLVGANVFDANGNFIYNYFAFPAPNGGPAFSAITAGQGGAAQGAQQLVTYNDYNNTDHANFPDRIIEANFFRDFSIGAADVGITYAFTFDAKLGDIEAPSTAGAFIKTLDPNAGFATTNLVFQDTTNTSVDWTTYSLSLTIDASLTGQIFQIGFLNTASGFNPSGNFYDNINVAAIPEPGTAGLLMLGLVGCAYRRRCR